MTDDPRLCRSFLTAPVAVPGDNSAKYLASGFTREGFEVPDWLVPDLEDGTAPSVRAEGVGNLVDLAATHASTFPGEVWPRIEWAYDDATVRKRGTDQIRTLIADAGDHLTGFVVPKVGELPNVRAAEAVVADAERDHGYDEGRFGMSVIVETARAKSCLRDIARWGRESRLDALVFGPVDYIAELGGRKVGGERPTWTGFLEDLSNEASANGLLAIGGPFDRIRRTRAGVEVYDADGYAEQAEREARHGLDGSWSLHPNQTVQANHIHLPDGDELRQHVRYVEAYVDARAEGSGAILVDGQMVDEGHVREFTHPLRTVVAVHRRLPTQTGRLYERDLLERALDLESEVL